VWTSSGPKGLGGVHFVFPVDSRRAQGCRAVGGSQCRASISHVLCERSYFEVKAVLGQAGAFASTFTALTKARTTGSTYADGGSKEATPQGQARRLLAQGLRRVYFPNHPIRRRESFRKVRWFRSCRNYHQFFESTITRMTNASIRVNKTTG